MNKNRPALPCWIILRAHTWSVLPPNTIELIIYHYEPIITLLTLYSEILDAVYIEHLIIPASSEWAVQVAEIVLEAEQVTSSPVNVTFDVKKDGIGDWSSECTDINYVMYRTDERQCAARRICNGESYGFLEVWPFNELCFISCHCRAHEKCIITFEVTPKTKGNPAELLDILISLWCKLCEYINGTKFNIHCNKHFSNKG